MTSFRTLGNSGLVVSPLALGTMTFGTDGWGANDDVSRAIFDAYIEAGGNFVDTADVYADGRSEELVGRFIGDRGLRDAVVLATKCGFHASDDANPHGGGNGRKHLLRALEGSLRRLRTDYVDLYWTHVWDGVTPAEEMVQTLGDLVRAGKIRYFAFSDVPAWYATKAATYAAAHAIPGPVAMQMEYSLVERGIETEHVPAARACGMGITPWGPLAGGFLTGKYRRDGDAIAGDGRLDTATGGFNRWVPLTDANWATLDVVRAVAAEHARTPAQIALAWVCAQPGITAPILGAGKLAQLLDTLGAADVALTPDQLRRLDEHDAPRRFFTPALGRMIFGGNDVRGFAGS